MAFEVSTKRDRFIIESDADSSKVLEIEFCELSSNPELKKMAVCLSPLNNGILANFDIKDMEMLGKLL